jgi:hypothetical protein
MNQTGAVVGTLPQAIRSTPAPVAGYRRGLFSGMSRAIAAGALALAFLAGAIQTRAQNTDYWVTNNGDFSTAANWSTDIVPQGGDTVVFTNNSDYTVTAFSFANTLNNAIISNTAGALTLDATGNKLSVSNTFRVGILASTTTVYLAGGTISVSATAAGAAGLLRIADAETNLYNCVAAMFVTNGTVSPDSCLIGSTGNSVGTLVIAESGIYTQSVNGGTITVGNSSSGNQLIVTNGGQLNCYGQLTLGSGNGEKNNWLLISGTNSAVTLTSGGVKVPGSSCGFVVSNGASLYLAGGGTLGANAAFDTGIVNNASLIVAGTFQVGANTSGGSNNLLLVCNGSYFSVNNSTLAFGNNSLHYNDGIQMGGQGLMSTGFATVVRSTSSSTNRSGNFVTVTNAFFSCEFLEPQGPSDIISVLANGTWMLTNGNAISVSPGNPINILGGSDELIVNGGTLIDLQTADNGGGINIGTGYDNLFAITNGGKVLSSAGTIGVNGGYNTGVVFGPNSVWSNFSTVVGSTNVIVIGAGANGYNNSFAVANGGALYNNGSFDIGNSPSAFSNNVSFGGVGAPSIINNTGSVNVGASSNDYGNVLIVTNATVNCGPLNVGVSESTNNLLQFTGGTISVGFVRVRSTNTVVFNAGSLEAGSSMVDPLANNGNAFLVGDGVSAAFYDMTASGSGYHNFGGGLVVTNAASLRGSGTLAGGPFTVLGSFVPGFFSTPASVVSSNNVTFGPSAVLDYNFGTPPSCDTATIQGNLGLGGTLTINNLAGFGVGNYTIFTYTGLLTNTLTNTGGTLTVGNEPVAGLNYAISTSTPGSVLLVVTAGAPPNPFVQWQQFYGLTGTLSSGNASYTGDGMSNTNKFMAGFNPTNAAAYLHIISIAKTNNNTDINVTYLGANGDSTYSGGPASRTNVLEFTTGTANGSYTNNFISTGQTNILNAANGLGTVTNMVDSGGATNRPSRYYRVRVLLP